MGMTFAALNSLAFRLTTGGVVGTLSEHVLIGDPFPVRIR